MKGSVYFIFFLLSLFACQNQTLFQEEKKILGDWPYHEALSFHFVAEDTLQVYDIRLITKHLPDFAYQNYYVLISTLFPDGNKTEQQLSIDLMDKYGRWSGKCSGNTCEMETYLIQNFKFPQAGEYKISIHQYGRDDNLPGIKSLTLKINRKV